MGRIETVLANHDVPPAIASAVYLTYDAAQPVSGYLARLGIALLEASEEFGARPTGAVLHDRWASHGAPEQKTLGAS